jgi:hypothetical protein
MTDDAASCFAASSCVSESTCIIPIIPTWPPDDADGGAGDVISGAASSLLTASGWALASTSVPCLIARNGQVLPTDGGAASPAFDIKGNVRDPVHPTIGAYEFSATGTCAP